MKKHSHTDRCHYLKN